MVVGCSKTVPFGATYLKPIRRWGLTLCVFADMFVHKPVDGCWEKTAGLAAFVASFNDEWS